MPNNPNEDDPKPRPQKNPPAVPPNPEDTDEVRVEDLPDLGPVDLAELSGDIPLDDHAPDGVWSERSSAQLPPVDEGLPDLPDDSHEQPLPSGEPEFADEGLVELPDLADAAESDSSHLFTAANPLPGAPSTTGGAPVAPASGWFDPNELEKTPSPQLRAEREFSDSDLFGGTPEKPGAMVESSDIFSGGGAPPADLATTSDVLLGAALDYATGDRPPAKPQSAGPSGSPSELPIGQMPMTDSEVNALLEARRGPGGAEAPSDVDDDGLFDGLEADLPPLSEVHSAPAKPPEPVAPPKPAVKPVMDLKELGITPDFGATPKAAPDASSILADLGQMEPSRHMESASEVRLDSPEFDRTIGGSNDGREFGLDLPSEIRSNKPTSPDSAPIEWSDRPDDVSDLPTDSGTGLEIELDDVQPPAPIKAKAPRPPEDDGDVEFTDFPDADLEAVESDVLSSKPATPPKPHNLTPTEVTPPISGEKKGSKPSLSALPSLASRRQAEQQEMPTKEAKTVPELPDSPAKAKSGTDSTGSVEIDWVAGSMPQKSVSGSMSGSMAGPVKVANWGPESIVQRGDTGRTAPVPVPVSEPVAEEYADEAPIEDDHLHTRPTKPDMAMRGGEPRRSGKGGWIGGMLVGAVLAGGGFAGAYFGGVLPNGEKTAQPPKKPDGENPDPGTPGSGKAPTAADVSAAIRAGDAATAKKLAAASKDPSPMLKAAQSEAELFALVQEQKDSPKIAPKDLQPIGEKLKAIYEDVNMTRTPEQKRAAVKAAIQLGIVMQLAGEEENARKHYIRAIERFPEYAATFEAALDRLDETAAPVPAMPDGSSRRNLTPADAQRVLLAVLILLQDEPPAMDVETEAGVHFWKAVKLAKNEKYTEAIEQLKKAKAAHIKQAKAAAGRGLNPLSDPLEQIFPRACDDLKVLWELQAAIAENKTVAEAFKKDGPAKALVEIEKRAAGAVKLMTDLKDATDKLTAAEKDLKEKKDAVTKLEKDIDEAKDLKTKAEKKLEDEEKARKSADEIVMGVVKELQAAKLLPEKYETPELLAAQKRAMDRATGPSLATLLSPAMMAVGGTGLSSAQLIDIAERLSKAEAATKVATDKLASEVKKLTADHAAALKKLTDAHATEVSKLKDDQTAELKKATDKFAADSKKLTDEFEAKRKDLDAAIVAEKKRTEEVAAKFKTDLGNAITPAAAIDLWLPLLIDLRRPSDSEGALAAAAKSLSTSQPDSEDVAKARTTAGLALLFQNKLIEAKAQFQAAKANPTFAAALEARKQWATAVELGLLSINDPLAAYRKPPELPAREPVIAARFLDAGVKAYKEGRFKDAVAALTEATKNDATDAVSWYFLGASKLALGETDAGKDDIRQGAVREAASNVTTQVISRALSPIQGAARDTITAARP